ncbi:hypothetical protein J2W95_002072 [Flavobacterium granuli]|uniref:Uncharacterized protein n=1 Tax=Flavobacterium granuli TaxID=280093 RepID=A0ABU1S2Y0_9FLAO|nr:hypothetical protein [Flavobacterium granuli]
MLLLAFQASPIHLKRKKEKKESRISSGGFKRSQVFLKKYYPTRVCSISFLVINHNEGLEKYKTRVEILSKTRRA